MKQLEQLPIPLLLWYREHARDLPWRRQPTPYRVWISEIMLQQTRVAAVLEYYKRFLEAAPTVADLAALPEEQLMKLWQGLGYYSRARNLQKAARQIMDHFGGVFPNTYEDIRSLSGVGDYTAGAISSIAFSQPRAAVDGNVLRVLSRLRNDREPIDSPACKIRVQRELEEIYPVDCPGEFTQALMELGATVCVPNGEPKCDSCPCASFCLGKENWQELPVKQPKREKRLENRTVFLLRCGDRYAIEKRPNRGLLAGLWQFPNVEGHLSEEEVLRWAESQALAPRELERQINRHHIFTHIRWEMRGWYLAVDHCGDQFVWKTLKEIDEQAALPTAFRQFREEINDV